MRPFKLNQELIKMIFPKDKTHRCAKQRIGFCPIEGDETKYLRCLGTKQLMEQYHSYREGVLKDTDNIERIKSIFEVNSAIEINYKGCCDSFYVKEGNTRLCISKKTGIPVYARINLIFKCTSCNHNDFYWSASIYRMAKIAFLFYIRK